MPSHNPPYQVPCVVPALVAAALFACGCSASGPQSQTFEPSSEFSQDDGGGLPTKGDDGGLGDKDDSGLGTKDDGGLGTKDDSGLGTGDDAGEGTTDAGSGSTDAGTSTPPDAGGDMNACFACAEQRGCQVQVNACVHSASCVDEGKCDLGCLSSGPFGALNPRCIESCSTDWHATQELLAAVTCGFRVCPVECLRPLISCGGDAGAGPVDPMEPGCIYGHGVVPH
jgi:hypothetical protein